MEIRQQTATSLARIPRLTGKCDVRILELTTQIPLDVIRPIIACSTEFGDLVVDPFNGSGTTGCAAKELGRKYLGIERSAEFNEIAEKRILCHGG